MDNSGKTHSIKQEIRESLKNLGFTDYFINIYTALLIGGEMNAHDLSERTGVPYSRIYEVLNDMIKRSIVTKIDGRPSTFIGNNPQDVFTALKHQRESEFEQLMAECLPYLQNMFGSKSTVKNAQFMVYEGEQPSRDHIRNVINASARLLLLALPEINDLYPVIKMNLDFLRTKGVQVRFILEEKNSANGIIDELKNFGEIRFIPKIEQNLIISDDRTAVQAQKGHFNIAKPAELDYCILTSTETKYVMYLAELFNGLWISAKK